MGSHPSRMADEPSPAHSVSGVGSARRVALHLAAGRPHRSHALVASRRGSDLRPRARCSWLVALVLVRGRADLPGSRRSVGLGALAGGLFRPQRAACCGDAPDGLAAGGGVEGALSSVDTRYEDAAASLGASRLTVFRRVTLPMIRSSLVAGTVLAWARALGEFGATITFAGNLQGRTQTLPLAVFVALESDRDVAIVLSLLLVIISLAFLLALRDRWWRG